MTETSSVQPIILTPADFADTGQWRLIINIADEGMCAFLRHISDREKPIVEMFRTNWTSSDPASLLKNIENAVYDHPGLLDDYATEIVIDSRFTTFAPSSVIDSEEDIETEIFETIYPGKDQEVLADRFGEITALYSLCNGLEGFLSRTIPGARIRNSLAILTEHFRSRTQEGARVYVDIKPGVADIIAFDNARLLAASTRTWQAEDDIAYMIFHLLKAYNLAPETTEIHISGLSNIRKSLTEKLRKFFSYVVRTSLPDIIDKYSLPAAVGILMSK